MQKKKTFIIITVIILAVFFVMALFRCNYNNSEDNIVLNGTNIIFKQIDKDKSNYIVLSDGVHDDKKIEVDFFLGDFSYSDGWIAAIETSNYQGICKINVEDGTSDMVIGRNEIEGWAQNNGFKKIGSVYQPEITITDIERAYFKISLDSKMYVCVAEDSQIRILFETDPASQYTVGSDKSIIYGVNGNNIISYSLITDESQVIAEHPSAKWISISPDGSLVAYQNNGLYLYNVKTDENLKICGNEKFTNKIVFSDNGKYIAYSVLHYGLFTTPDYGTLYVYDLEARSNASIMKLKNEGQTGYFSLY